MSELPSTLPEREVYQELIEEAKDTDDVKTLREMARADLASVATPVTIKAEGGETIDVTAIGSEKFSELAKVDKDTLNHAMAVHSDGWQNEQK